MELDRKALGLACGLMWGIAVLGLTITAILRGAGEHLELLGVVYLGYEISYKGCLIGTLWGFVDGFFGGWILAWLYNRLRSQPATAPS